MEREMSEPREAGDVPGMWERMHSVGKKWFWKTQGAWFRPYDDNDRTDWTVAMKYRDKWRGKE
jgi:hypothetical protein